MIAPILTMLNDLFHIFCLQVEFFDTAIPRFEHATWTIIFIYSALNEGFQRLIRYPQHQNHQLHHITACHLITLSILGFQTQGLWYYFISDRKNPNVYMPEPIAHNLQYLFIFWPRYFLEVVPESIAIKIAWLNYLLILLNNTLNIDVGLCVHFA